MPDSVKVTTLITISRATANHLCDHSILIIQQSENGTTAQDKTGVIKPARGGEEILKWEPP